MKLTQDLIVFDLEATSSEDEAGFQLNKNIIQIGAVYLRRVESKKYEIADRFNRLIKPKDEEISAFITELTGISNEDVRAASMFDLVGEEFSAWAQKYGNIKHARLCAWGTYFDVPLLRAAYRVWGKEFPFSGSAYDVKSWAALWLMLSGKRSDKLTVKSVSEMMGIEPAGTLHDASVDAELTARIALRIFADLDHGVFMEEKGGAADHYRIV